MKKILSLVLALMMLVGGVLALSSCGKVKPNLNFDEAKTKLEAAGYEVSIVDKKESLDPGEAKYFRAYKTGDENTDSQYLYITEYKDKKLAKMYYEEMVTELENSIAAMKAQIEIYERTLKLYQDELDSDTINEINDEIKELNEELVDYEENYTYGISGTVVWYGTVKAAEATK